MLSVVLAVIAASCNAVSSVLQRKANLAESRRRDFGPALLLHLLSRPVWLFGILALIASFLLQAAALGSGRLSIVEPVLVLELPLALVLGARVLHRRLHRRDWLAGAGMAAGLAAMLAALAPSDGDPRAVHLSSAVLAAIATAASAGAIALVGFSGRLAAEHRRSASPRVSASVSAPG